jgi:glyoxylase-like metal-dependent hydrolase (beta-lactamase superfamily II)
MLSQNVADGVHRVRDAYVNWYLVEDGRRLTVVDAGHPRSWRSLDEAVRAIGRQLADIEALVLTHAHFDHVGFAERARRELGVPVHVHSADARLARHPWRYAHESPRSAYAIRHPGFIARFAAMGAAGALAVKGVEEVRTFDAPGALDVPGRPHVVPTPGHTDGHCALHLPERGVLICGDALVTFDPYTGRSGPRIVARAATADSSRALRSLDAISATPASVLLPGHGDAFNGGAERAARLAREAGVG